MSVIFLVNYRGSTGYGQDGVYSLPGKIGTQDVNDVQVCVCSLSLSLSLSLSASKQSILGIVEADKQTPLFSKLGHVTMIELTKLRFAFDFIRKTHYRPFNTSSVVVYIQPL